MRPSILLSSLAPFAAGQSYLFPVVTRTADAAVSSRVSSDLFNYGSSVGGSPAYTSAIVALGNQCDCPKPDNPVALAGSFLTVTATPGWFSSLPPDLQLYVYSIASEEAGIIQKDTDEEITQPVVTGSSLVQSSTPIASSSTPMETTFQPVISDSSLVQSLVSTASSSTAVRTSSPSTDTPSASDTNIRASDTSSPSPSPSPLALGLGLGLGIPLLIALFALCFVLGCHYSRRRNSDERHGWRTYVSELRRREQDAPEPQLPAYSGPMLARADSIHTVSKAELPTVGDNRVISSGREAG